MRRMLVGVGLAAVVALGVSAGRAETAADLLQKGIYAEETVGDLDAAMKIYKQIVADDKANRPAVARAQYRLGMCLVKKGKKEEAAKTFEDLVRRFPDQKQWVTEAKKYLSPELKLIPAPWKDGEVFHIVLKTGGGTGLGNYVFRAKETEYKGRKVWLLQYWQRLGGVAYTGVSRVYADRQSLRPIHSLVDNTAFGRFTTDYTSTEATVHRTVQGKDKDSTNVIALDGVRYDNEQGYYVFRCMPLEVGYAGSFPLLSTFTSTQIDLPVNATSKEQVKVAAGQFECYRLDLGLVNQTFWISADENRHLVKFEAGGISGELTAVNPKDANRFASEKWGCSIAAPEGWMLFESPVAKSDGLLVDVIDPESTAVVLLHVEKQTEAKPGEKRTARQLAEKNLSKLGERFKDFKVRSESWTERTVSGRPAVSFVVDYASSGAKKVGYVTFVPGDSAQASVLVQVDEGELDAIRKTIDPVIDTLKVK